MKEAVGLEEEVFGDEEVVVVEEEVFWRPRRWSWGLSRKFLESRRC